MDHAGVFISKASSWTENCRCPSYILLSVVVSGHLVVVLLLPRDIEINHDLCCFFFESVKYSTPLAPL